jgi:hypothetical protein
MRSVVSVLSHPPLSEAALLWQQLNNIQILLRVALSDPQEPKGIRTNARPRQIG